MTRLKVTALLMAASVTAMSGQGEPAAVDPPALAGTWTLNRELSHFRARWGSAWTSSRPAGPAPAIPSASRAEA